MENGTFALLEPMFHFFIIFLKILHFKGVRSKGLNIKSLTIFKLSIVLSNPFGRFTGKLGIFSGSFLDSSISWLFESSLVDMTPSAALGTSSSLSSISIGLPIPFRMFSPFCFGDVLAVCCLSSAETVEDLFLK